MGGGDLNLKKSWHPSTIRNIERVWKAEQKHDAEQKKIEQLQRELTEERCREEIQHYAEDKGVVSKKGERLDWMYQGPSALIDNDQYLLGRKVDTTFEVLRLPQVTPVGVVEDAEPKSIFSNTAGNTAVDLGNKIREDPLFEIRKREKEQKKRLLDNPVKLKQLRQMLEQSVGEDKKNDRKKKKHKHRKHDSDVGSKQIKSTSHLGREEHYKTSSHHATLLSQKRKDRGGRQVSDSSDDEKVNKGRASTKHSKMSLDSRDSEGKWHNHRRYLVMHNKQANSSSHSHKLAHSPESRHMDKSQSSSKRGSPLSKGNTNGSKCKLTQEEMDRLRQEMMDNASWRDEQRKKNISRYKEDDLQELLCQKSEVGASFIRPMLSSAAEKGSVAGRIKQNIYNIQRSESAMEKNFARR